MKEEDSNSWKKLQQKSLSRRNLIRGAAGTAAGAGLLLSSAGATSLPALLPSLRARAQTLDNGHRIFTFVSFSEAPLTSTGVRPRIGLDGAGTFDPGAGWVKGGGNFTLFDQAKPTPKPLIAAGFWQPTAFVSYDTKGLGSFGKIQPAILTVLADFDEIGSGLTMEVICNVGALGAAGMTGEDEGWKLLATPAYGDFVPLSPGVGITHMSVEGISIACGA